MAATHSFTTRELIRQMLLKSHPSTLSFYCSSSKQSIKHRCTLYPAIPTAVLPFSTVHFLLLWKQTIAPWRLCWSSVLGSFIQDIGCRVTSYAGMEKVDSWSQCGCMVLLGGSTLAVETPLSLYVFCWALHTREQSLAPGTSVHTCTLWICSTTGKEDCGTLSPSEQENPPNFSWVPGCPCHAFPPSSSALCGSNFHSLPISLLWDQFLGLLWQVISAQVLPSFSPA